MQNALSQLHLKIKCCAESIHYFIYYTFHARGRVQQVFQADLILVLQAAGNNALPVAHIRRYVEGKSMAGDAVGIDFDANGCDLARSVLEFRWAMHAAGSDIRLHPNTGLPRNLPGRNAQFSQGLYEHRFQLAQVTHIICLGDSRFTSFGVLGNLPQWDERITHKLSGSMVGHIAAAIHPMDVDILLLQPRLLPEEVFLLSTAAKGVDVGMFEQQQRWRLLASCNLGSQLVLQMPGFLVFDDAEAEDLAGRHENASDITIDQNFVYQVEDATIKFSMSSGTIRDIYKSSLNGTIKNQPKVSIKTTPEGFRPNCVCVEDAFFGDSGKGAVVAKFNKLLNKKENLVSIRFNGGANAGHESKLGEKLIVTHQLPMGVIAEGAIAIISRGMVIHPEDLITEISNIEESLGGELPGKLIIDDRVPLALDTHRAFESALNSFTTGGRGSTGKGISPGYASHYERISITLKDLLANDWEEKLKAHYKLYKSLISGSGNETQITKAQVPVYSKNRGEKRKVGSEKVFIERLKYARDKVKRYSSSEVPALLENVWKNEKIPVTIEGAQGAGLDPYHGVYPDITASRPMSRFLNDATYNIILPEHIFHRVAVMKTTYMSSVGIRKLPAERDENLENWIQETFDERGRTTGRLRDIFPISIPIATYLRKAAGYNFIVATHLDASKKDQKVKVVIGYVDKKTGKKKPYLPYQDHLNTLKPIFVDFDGWDGSRVAQAKSIETLPKEARTYLTFLGAAIAPVSMCTFGPGLDEYLSWKN